MPHGRGLIAGHGGQSERAALRGERDPAGPRHPRSEDRIEAHAWVGIDHAQAVGAHLGMPDQAAVGSGGGHQGKGLLVIDVALVGGLRQPRSSMRRRSATPASRSTARERPVSTSSSSGRTGRTVPVEPSRRATSASRCAGCSGAITPDMWSSGLRFASSRRAARRHQPRFRSGWQRRGAAAAQGSQRRARPRRRRCPAARGLGR
jgi:hypothetical protein